MSNNEMKIAAPRPRLFGRAFTQVEKRRMLRYAAGTVLGCILFIAALMAPDFAKVRMPGHIVLYWFPALMAGRALAGYRGGGILIGFSGGLFGQLSRHTLDTGIFDFVIAACVVEGMLLLRQQPTAWMAVLMGVAANLTRMLPKVAIIFSVGATPHHNRETLGFMLESYLLFGALAGLLYAGGLFLARKAKQRFSQNTNAASPTDDPGTP